MKSKFYNKEFLQCLYQSHYNVLKAKALTKCLRPLGLL